MRLRPRTHQKLQNQVQVPTNSMHNGKYYYLFRNNDRNHEVTNGFCILSV